MHVLCSLRFYIIIYHFISFLLSSFPSFSIPPLPSCSYLCCVWVLVPRWYIPNSQVVHATWVHSRAYQKTGWKHGRISTEDCKNHPNAALVPHFIPSTFLLPCPSSLVCLIVYFFPVCITSFSIFSSFIPFHPFISHFFGMHLFFPSLCPFLSFLIHVLNFKDLICLILGIFIIMLYNLLDFHSSNLWLFCILFTSDIADLIFTFT